MTRAASGRVLLDLRWGAACGHKLLGLQLGADGSLKLDLRAGGL